MNATSVAAASNAASAANPSVPARVDNSLRVTCTGSLLSPGHGSDARAERVQVARLAAGAGVDGLDVLDEVPDDVAGVVVGHRVVAVALARVGEALDRAGPPRDVEGREVRDRHRGAAAAAEGAEGRQEYMEHAGIARWDVWKAAPVVRRGARGRLLGSEDPQVHARRHLVRRPARLHGHARPRLRRAPERRRAGGARRALVDAVLRRTALRQLLLEGADVGIAVQGLVLASAHDAQGDRTVVHRGCVREVAAHADADDEIVRARQLRRAAPLQRIRPLHAVLPNLSHVDRAGARLAGAEGALDDPE